jgi:hypothetical protein
MEFNEWLKDFRSYLKEYGVNPERIKKFISEKDDDIRFAYSRNADPEMAVLKIGKAYFNEKREAEDKKNFERYSKSHPKIYSVQHCMDNMFNRIDALRAYLEQLRLGSEKYETCHKLNPRLKMNEEYHTYDINKVTEMVYSRLADSLIMRLGTTKDKILLVSVLKSKYSVLYEMLSFMSNIPLVILETGISEEMEQQSWDDLSEAMSYVNIPRFFLMDLLEPVKLDEFLEDLTKAQDKGDFDLIVVSGLSYLNESHQDDLFKYSHQLLSEFGDKFKVNVVVIP